jgi:hypothetical protein
MYHIYSTRLHFFGSDVHEAPGYEEVDDGVKRHARVGGATGRARDSVAENPARELKHLGARDDEKYETRDKRRDELSLLLFAIASTATIFKHAHL